MPAEQRMPPCVEWARVGNTRDNRFDHAARRDHRTDHCTKQAPTGRVRTLRKKAPRRLVTALRVFDGESEPRTREIRD